MNQHGAAQAIGGAHHKIEGFYKTCSNASELNGTQGVVVPDSNKQNLVLRSNILDAIRREQFTIYSVETIEDAVELFMGIPAGAIDKSERFPEDTIFGKVLAQLKKYDEILKERERGL